MGLQRLILTLAFLALLCAGTAWGKRSLVTSVPFDMVGSYIIMEIAVNDSDPLHFILDSGISSTLITELSAGDSVSLYYTEKTEVKGLGAGEHISAWASYGNELKAGKIKFSDQTIFVLEEDIFSLSRHAGTRINGILGADLFEDYVVTINYDKRRIQFHTDSLFQVPKGYCSVPMTLEGHKMFLNTTIEDAGGRIRKTRMLFDTGAELAAWFRSFGQDPIPVPAKNIRGFIGKGLNGEIEGFLGRMNRIWLGDFPVHKPIVSFPDSASISDAILQSDRDGTLGSQVLSRFNHIVAQNRGLFYFKPSMRYRLPFRYNIAGIEVIQHEEVLPLPEIRHLWKGSSGEKAGLQPGDLILEINGTSSFKIPLEEVKSMFESSHFKKLNLLIIRNGQTHAVSVTMQEEL